MKPFSFTGAHKIGQGLHRNNDIHHPFLQVSKLVSRPAPDDLEGDPRVFLFKGLLGRQDKTADGPILATDPQYLAGRRASCCAAYA